ncbi:type VI secretion system Vgr family protein [Janthinobacterium sp. PC23-8]|uniref:type VI secretion system Vgr family protein n=1 Tax=Janthinobacterium sp. PC23-8 TaxID=2012679 RepID=UPI000B965961|nr:type VI secretion system Vgr family protein [Janthinobacterium sp. PC23-8]OYO27933.1 hypothetical protein CD932_22760 [Janthinobacterium sp. PC23-8]
MVSLPASLENNNRFAFVSEAYPDGATFAVIKMNGVEAISRPFRFELTMFSDKADIDFDQMLTQPAGFGIYATDGSQCLAPYYGVLAEFEYLCNVGSKHYYRAVLVPRLWKLSMDCISRVYLDKEQTILDIIKKALDTGSILSSDDYELPDHSIKPSKYVGRDFVYQYRESTLDFLSRWMEKEGLYYWVEHDETKKKDKLIVAEIASRSPLSALQFSCRPIDGGASSNVDLEVNTFIRRQKPLPKRVIVQDHNPLKSAVPLRYSADVCATGTGDLMMHGEHFGDEEDGKRYAALRADEIKCGGKVFHGTATAVGMRSGFLITLANYGPKVAPDTRYLIVEIEHQGLQADTSLQNIGLPIDIIQEKDAKTVYRTSFRAIDSAVQFRPQRITPKPCVTGTMEASIDADAGVDSPYANLDELGRYKVKFPFYQDDPVTQGAGSARIRMATPYSGADHGMHFPLHKGASVLLSFVEGDPDRPVILAAVPNSENRSVVTSENNTVGQIKSAGGNKISFLDEKGKEAIWLETTNNKASIKISEGNSITVKSDSYTSSTNGASNTYFKGIKNSVSLSMENSVMVGVTNKSSIALNTAFSVGFDASFKIGAGLSYSQNSLSMAPTAGLTGNKKISIKAGQHGFKSVIFESRVKIGLAVVALASAANAVIGLLNAKGINSDDSIIHDKESSIVVKHFIPAMVISAATAALAAYIKLQNKSEDYTSTIDANDEGIFLKAKKDPGLLGEDVAPSSEVLIVPEGIVLKVNANGIGPAKGSNIRIFPNTVNIQADGEASSIFLNNECAELVLGEDKGFYATHEKVVSAFGANVGIIQNHQKITIFVNKSEAAKAAGDELNNANMELKIVEGQAGFFSQLLGSGKRDAAIKKATEALNEVNALPGNASINLDGNEITLGFDVAKMVLKKDGDATINGKAIKLG